MNAENSSERRKAPSIDYRYEFFVRSFETSVKYAEMYLKHCFVLNGGAILAFPTMAQLSDVTIHDHKAGFILSLTAFSVGLASCLIAVAAASGWFDKIMTVANIESYIDYQKDRDENYDINSVTEYLRKRDWIKERKYRRRYAKTTLRSAAVSGIAFMIGIITAGLVISELDLLLLDLMAL